ncbi:hypothetical protein ES707_05549 [subsurface metagenome]
MFVLPPEAKTENTICSAPASRAAFSPIAAACISVRPTISASRMALYPISQISQAFFNISISLGLLIILKSYNKLSPFINLESLKKDNI